MENKKIKLFVNSKKAMKFSIFQGRMLNIKCNQVSKKIKEYGGIIIDYVNKDEECVILAHKSCIPSDTNVFNIKYIRDCISKNEILNLLKYRISNPIQPQKSHNTNKCIDITKILKDEKCRHRTSMSIEELILKINKATQ